MLKKIIPSLVFFLGILCLWLAVFGAIIPKSDTKLSKKDFLANRPKTLTYVAIGDSLTEGIGDITNQGGFIPLLAKDLDTTYNYQTKTVNYGVSGNTSNQILRRMTKDIAIQRDLKKADVMTLTVGGNDVLAVIRQNLLKLNRSTFDKPAKAYQNRLRKIIDLARQENSDLPIYILGIYNPFYLNFPEMTQMQEVVDNWNLATQKVIEEYDQVYFVPINDLLYKGIDGQEGIVSISGNQTKVINDALFTEDHFHPNNIGYQMMATAVMEAIRETKTNW